MEGGEREYGFYCVKCRSKKECADFKKGVAKNGRPYVEAVCPDCGTRMFKFVAKE
ncbi:MAG: DUF5679 domain-containing protein [Patescibacteria group bacterium]